jgi:hypothetical protein
MTLLNRHLTFLCVLMACALPGFSRGTTDTSAEPRWFATVIPGDGNNARCELRVSPKDRAFLAGTISAGPDGKSTFTAETIDWFNNSSAGWMEAEIAVSGTFEVSPAPAGKKPVAVTVRPAAPIEIVSVASARVRYRDTIVYGPEAISLVERRLDRVVPTIRWLAEKTEGRDFPESRAKKRKDRAGSFEFVAGGFLFPEIYGYPAGTYAGKPPKEQLKKGEGLLWNSAWTAVNIPEWLREVRDSGTSFRDWEESLDLFYFLYKLEN